MSDTSKSFGQVGNEKAPNVLLGSDADAILKIYREPFLTKIREINVDPVSVDLFLADYFGGNARPEGGYESLNDNQIIAYNELVITNNVINAVALDKASLNRRKTPENNPYKLEDALKLYKEAGFDAAFVEKKVLGKGRQNGTITAHPTGDLNEQHSFDLSSKEGVENLLGRILQPMSGEPDPLDEHTTAVDKRLALMNSNSPEDVDKIIGSMLEGKMAPTRRLNTFEELVNAFMYGVRDRIATGNMLENLHKTSHEVYGAAEHSHPINPIDDNFDFAALIATWVDDTDGKPNAEHVALLAFDALNIMVSASFHLENLELIKDKEPSIAKDKHFKELSNAFSTMQERLTPLIIDIAALYNRLHDSSITEEVRGQRYIETQEKFEKLNNQVGEVLNNIKLDGRSLNNHGVDLFSRIERFYRHLVHELDGTDAQTYARQSAAIIHKSGLGLLKSEARTGRPVVNQTADNLLKNPEFLNYLKNETDMFPALIEELENLNGQKPSEMEFEQLNRISNAIDRAVKPEKLLEFLEKSNPLEPSKETGYPNQNYAFVQRTKVKAKYGLLHGAFITAEADHNSGVLTRLILDAHGEKLSRTPVINLREDLHIMVTSTESVKLSSKTMQEAIVKRGEQDSRVRHQHNLAEVQMWAQSDSQKSLGPLSSLMIARQVQRDTEFVLDHWFKDGAKDGDVLPLLQKIGSGLDPQRGGGDPMVFPRLIAHTMQNYMKKHDIDPDKLPDEFIRMAMNVDYTIQGRAIYKTPDEIQIEREQQMAEMMFIHAELKGIVKEGTAIPQLKPFSENMAKFLDEMTLKAMDQYMNFRGAKAKPEDKQAVLDTLMDVASPRKTVAKSNNAARMQAKGGKGVNIHTGQRAIGSRNENAAEGGHHDADFSEGQFLETLHQALHEGYELKSGETIKLTTEDIDDLKIHGYSDYQVNVRTLVEKAQTDYEHAFKQLELREWDSEKIYNVAKATKFTIQDDETVLLEWPQDVKPEQALEAVYYSDFRKHIIGLNALKDGNFVKNANLYNGNPKSIPLKPDFNEAVRANYPFINSVEARSKITQPALDNLRIHDTLSGTTDESDRSVASAWRTGFDAAKRELVGDGYQFAWGRRKAPINIEDSLTEKYGGNNKPLTHSDLVGSYVPEHEV